MAEAIDAVVSRVYRAEWGRILATLIRSTNDFSLAEEAVQEAFAAATTRWRDEGVPSEPRAWLIQTARHVAIDRIRRAKNFAKKLDTYAADLETTAAAPGDPLEIPDDRLRLIFTCCHPSLNLEAQIALTLRTMLGLDTEAIARAFVTPVTTMAQRIVRAKKKIADANIPYVVPETSEMPERLHAVMTVLYLVFNEGYAATHGESMLRTDLSAEAIRMTRVIRELLDEPDAARDVTALLAMMLLHDSRREARVDESGDVVVLDDQDRSKWDAAEIAEALPLVDDVMATEEPSMFALQAAIAAVHARATTKDATDWPAIVRLYERMEALDPSPILTLNRAVAVAMVEGPAAGLAIVDALAAGGALDEYHLLHAARADFARRLGDKAEAAKSYRRALEWVGNESERRFLERRLAEL